MVIDEVSLQQGFLITSTQRYSTCVPVEARTRTSTAVRDFAESVLAELYSIYVRCVYIAVESLKLNALSRAGKSAWQAIAQRLLRIGWPLARRGRPDGAAPAGPGWVAWRHS